MIIYHILTIILHIKNKDEKIKFIIYFIITKKKILFKIIKNKKTK